LAVALFVLGVAVQFAFIGEAARALGQANYQGRNLAVNLAANQSAAAGEIVDHIEERALRMT